MAIHLMCSSKQGRSALQLQRNLELGSYRTAWFMCHRIRWAMTQSPMTELLMKGVVEWMRPTLKIAKKVSAECRGQTPRRLVLALIECGGNVRSFPIERATVKNIGSIMRQHIDPESRVFTDEFPVYYYMKPDFPNHHTINNKSKRVCAP